ncbi:MAG: hypothetical protein PHF30_04855 [Bacilli bacterium]|nr:hypothetical protein [Bacilli bacterium]
MEVMIVNKINNSYFINNNITVLYGHESDLPIIINNYYDINYDHKVKVKTFINNEIDSLKALNLDYDILNKKLSELSFGELKLILLIKAVISNPGIIILNNFEKGFSAKYYNLIWHFIKNITLSEDIKFLIVSTDLKFINKITKKIIIIKNKIIKYQGDLITALKQNLIELPEIIKFINSANNKGAKLTYTLDNKELLKDIYRSLK